jgi:hypothetical protein
MLAEPTADTLENLTPTEQPPSNSRTEDFRENDQLVPTEFAASSSRTESASVSSSRVGAPGSTSALGVSRSSSSRPSPDDDEFLREREVESTSEGMPSGELDEEPPKADSATAGE